MHRSAIRLILVLVFLLLAGYGPTGHTLGQEVDDRVMIEKSIQSYIDAFNSRDAKLLAAH